MAQATYVLHSKDSVQPTGRWSGRIRSWLRARREKKEKKQVTRDLLSYDERYLEDLGLSRWELVREFGHDPYAIPELYRWRARGLPHI